MSGLSPETVMQLLDEGKTQVAIAREYGVSRQYVNQLVRKAGVESVITIVQENAPWKTTSEINENTIFQGLRLAAHYNYTGGKSLSGSSLDKLRRLVRKLELFNQVIDYDPSYPPIPGHSNTPGFAFVPRQPEDEDFMIKIRPGVRITSIGNKIWRMPKLPDE